MFPHCSFNDRAGQSASRSICRCYGTWTDISAQSVDGEPMAITLVAVNNDPTDLQLGTSDGCRAGLIVAEEWWLLS
jgi:hypothetical protein